MSEVDEDSEKQSIDNEVGQSHNDIESGSLFHSVLKGHFSNTDRLIICLSALVCASLFIFIFPFTSPKETSSENWFLFSLNLMIYGLAFLAFIKCYLSIDSIGMEYKTSVDVLESGKRMLADYKSSKVITPKFTAIYGLLSTDAQNSTEIGILVKRIIGDAEDYIYESRESIITPYGTEMLKKLQPFDSIQSNALRFGILGTFIGLVLAISELAGMVDFSDAPTSAGNGLVERRDMFINLSEKLFSAMQFSFGTSIAGLLVSIYTASLAVYIKYRVNQAIRITESVVVTIASLARRASYEDDGILSSFAQVKSSIDILKQDVHDQVGSASESMLAVGNHVVEQTQQIKEGISVIAETKKDWKDHLEYIRTQQESILELSHRQNEAVRENLNLFKKEAELQQSALLEEVTKCMKVLSAEKLGADINQHFVEMNQSLNNQMENAFSTQEQISSHVSGKLEELGNQLSNTLSDSLDNIDSHLSKTGENLLQNINEDLSSFSHAVEIHNTNKDELITAINENTDYNKTLITQLKDRGQIEALSGLQSTLKNQLTDLIICQQQLNTNIKDLTTHPVHQSLFNQISETAFAPLTNELSTVTEKILQIEKTMGTLSQVGTKLDNQLNEISKQSKNIFERLSSRGVRIAVATNSFTGFFLSFIVAVLAIFAIYEKFK